MQPKKIDLEQMRTRWRECAHAICQFWYEFVYTGTTYSRDRLAKRFGLVVKSGYSKDRRADIFAASHSLMVTLHALIEKRASLDDVKVSLADMAKHNFHVTIDLSGVGTLND